MQGATVSHYLVGEPVGHGGMGVVYRAEDVRLGRAVALKFLPEGLFQSARARERFRREARAVSALNHPNICTLYDADEHDGQPFIVMELIEGSTLKQLIATRRLTMVQVLQYGVQIADALDAAHRRGIVHRDIKPSNIVITASGGQVKILDFGLAKSAEDQTLATEADDGATTNADPILTSPGIAVGTPAYMSPEQAAGDDVDHRTDLFSAGLVLFEMATGRPVYTGSSTAIAEALEHRAPFVTSHLAPDLPPGLGRILDKSLERDPELRYQSASDLRADLKRLQRELAGDSHERARAAVVTAAPAPVRRRVAVAGGLALFAVATLGVVYLSRSLPTEPVNDNAGAPRFSQRLNLSLPADAPLAPWSTMPTLGTRPALALSRDGRRLVYSALTPSGVKLVVFDMSSGRATPIARTEGGHTAFFSPDGEAVGYFSAGRLWVTPLAEGAPVAIADAATPAGAAWGDDGVIFFGPDEGAGLYKVVPGGRPQRVHDDVATYAPYPLRPNHGLLVARGNSVSLIRNRKVTTLTLGFAPVFVDSGHIVYANPGALMAVPFDEAAGVITGPSVALANDLLTGRYGAAQFTVGRDGTLVYAPGHDVMSARFVRVGRDGQRHMLGMPEMNYGPFSLSPDGRRLVASVSEDANTVTTALWVFDVAHPERQQKVTAAEQGIVQFPKWAPDGDHLIYNLKVDRESRLVWSLPDGSDQHTLWRGAATEVEWLYPMSFSPDGKVMAVFGRRTHTSMDIYALRIRNEDGTLVNDGALELIVTGPALESFPQFSPDGHWLMYSSTATGRYEVYVTRYPVEGTPCVVAPDGALEGSWTAGGREIVYQDQTSLYARAVLSLADCRFGPPRLLFGDVPDRPGFGHDVFPDGSFLVTHSDDYVRPVSTLKVITDLPGELRRRAQARAK